MTTKRVIAVGSAGLSIALIISLALVGRPTGRRAATGAPAARAVISAGARDARRLVAERLRVVDQALSRRDVSAAVFVWHAAYAAALGTRGWRPLVDVGDAAVRIGDTAHSHAGARATAHQVYLVALSRAERAGDVDGLLETGEAFARLGDEALARQCLLIAEHVAVARGDPVTTERVRTVRSRLEETIAGRSAVSSARERTNRDPKRE